MLFVCCCSILVVKGHERAQEKDTRYDEREVKKESDNTFSKVLIQVLIINKAFSLETVITAVGSTNGITAEDKDALVIMLLAAWISLNIMIFFTNTINTLVEKYLLLRL